MTASPVFWLIKKPLNLKLFWSNCMSIKQGLTCRLCLKKGTFPQRQSFTRWKNVRKFKIHVRKMKNKEVACNLGTMYVLDDSNCLRVSLLWTDTMTKANLIKKQNKTLNWGWLTGSEIQSSIIKVGAWLCSGRHSAGRAENSTSSSEGCWQNTVF